MIQAEGQEVLVLDADLKVQKGIEHLLRSAGLTPTVLADVQRGLDLCAEKFFAVALVDLDTPTPDGGVAVIKMLRARSPKTAIIAMAPRRVFDTAVRAFRAGADEVVVKTPDQVDLLRTRVVQLSTETRHSAGTMQLLDQVTALHEDLMKVLLETYKRAMDLEQAAGRGDDDVLDEVTSVLLVEDDGWLGGQLAGMLDERYELESVPTGGQALDAVAGERQFQIALVKDSLPDLPGSMVVRTVKAQSPDTIVLHFTGPRADRPGAVEVVETHRTIPFLAAFTDPRQLADRLDELRDAFRVTTKERRYLGAFRQQHFDLLKRFAELKQKLQKAKSK